jgi:hypothetical protein
LQLPLCSTIAAKLAVLVVTRRAVVIGCGGGRLSSKFVARPNYGVAPESFS